MPDWLIALAQVFEAGMLICFGFAWPVDILRTLRTRQTVGKSIGFMSLILVGYLFGLAAKIMRAGDAGGWPETVTLLYAANAVLVAIDIGLCRYFRTHPGLP
jgi:hypothetical protein